MAELTDRASAADGDVDAQSVRVAVVGSPADPTLRVGFAPEPLRMANPTVGTGLLGGAAVVPLPDGGLPVLAQRQLLIDGEPSDAVLGPGSRGRHAIDVDGRRARVVLGPERAGEGGLRVREVLVAGFTIQVATESERLAALKERATRGRRAGAHSGPLQVKAIIPGKVVAVSVKAGDQVEAGQQLLVVEAMKMQNELRSPRDGTIERVGVTVGVNIEIGDLLVVIG